MKPCLLCDVDGVLADFMTATLTAIEAVTGREYTAEQVTSWDVCKALGLTADEWRRVVEQHVKQPGYCVRFRAYPGAIPAVKALSELFDVVFVTAPWAGAPYWVPDREYWLAQRFGKLGRRVVHTRYKELIRGDIIIDDNAENCERWTRHSWGFALLWDQPWNRDHETGPNLGVIRVHNWAEVSETIRAWVRAA